MSIQYGSLYVDEQYKATVLPNLFYKTWLVPGVTYQDVMVDGAGGCYWHKLTSTAASVGTPGRDFTDTAAADTLVQAVFNNNLQASKKIYGVQAAAVAFPIAEEHLALATREVAEAKNQCALACLISEGTASTNTRDQLLDEVWGFEYYGDSRTIDVHVKRLREKLAGASDKWELKTVWGVGYKFEVRQ